MQICCKHRIYSGEISLVQYSTGTSHCSCRLTQGRPLCRPATFVPIMLQAHTMHLRTSIKGTHFSRTVTRRILADAHRHSFTVAMSEFGLEWAIHRGAKRLELTGVTSLPLANASVSARSLFINITYSLFWGLCTFYFQEFACFATFISLKASS